MTNQLIWYRNDLRLADHQALSQAINNAKENNGECFAIFFWSETQWCNHGAGDNRLAATLIALKALNEALANLGITFTVIEIDKWEQCAEKLQSVCAEWNISHVHCHYEPGYDEYNRDKQAKETLTDVKLLRYNDLFFIHPQKNLNKQGSFYRVFTAYKKATLNALEQESIPIIAMPTFKPSTPTQPLAIEDRYEWANPLNLAVTENQAHDRLEDFLTHEQHYKTERDIPSLDGTSKLSVALSLGTITSKQIAWALIQRGIRLTESTYFSEILWREFYKYLTHFRADICLGKPFYEKWDQFPWQQSDQLLSQWQTGHTGVPIVDAAMRQLNTTGWMHNRLRMVCAMYLVKILQINWRLGEQYFAQKLADFDFAANNGGWQWVASTGVDAVPYFRIFNPYEQTKRFDPEGIFIRKYLPELADADNKQLQKPAAIITQGGRYPEPLVDYKAARTKTLELFKAL